MKRALAALVLVGMLGSCASRPVGTAGPPALSAAFDCLRERNAAVVSAHRGQRTPAALENALSSLRDAHAARIPLLEIDIATTSDGVLVLMHDDRLDRTTTGTGLVAQRTAAELSPLRLKRPDGSLTREPIPRLADVLAWGARTGARFQLDVKRSTRFADVVTAVRQAGMQTRVIVITYNLDDAARVIDLDPVVMVSTSIPDARTLEQAFTLARTELPPARLLGWTGTRAPAPALFARLRSAGIEPLFGTLGASGTRLDDVYLADGNPSEYRDLVGAGVTMVASDTPVIAQRAIGPAYRACWN